MCVAYQFLYVVVLSDGMIAMGYFVMLLMRYNRMPMLEVDERSAFNDMSYDKSRYQKCL